MSNQEDCRDRIGTPPKTYSRMKRKFTEAASTSSDAVPVETKPTTHQLPEKRLLELVLDTFQRRDPGERFAQPVDATQVEDYYEVVKEPMDFGTMRAKLHEGMYQNLEQFERDVFLIPRNAMNFNPPNSPYYKLARVIYELAKKVFHVVKTEPENFEVKFPSERRRSTRKTTGENKASPVKKDIPSRRTRRTYSGQSSFKRGKGRYVSNMGPTNVKKSCYNFDSDDRRNQGLDQPVEVDPRNTYKPLEFGGNSLHDQTIFSDPISLSVVNQQELSYKDSLMRFVKDLGPTVQNFAKKKLEGSLGNSAPCQIPGSGRLIQAPRTQTFTPFEAPSWRFKDPLLRSDYEGAKAGKDVYNSNIIGDHEASISKFGGHEAKLANKSPEVKETSKPNEVKVFKRRKVNQTNKIAEKNTPITPQKQKGAADTRRSEDTVLPVILALEHTRPNANEMKARNKSLIESPWLSKKSSYSILQQEAAKTTIMKPPESGMMIGSSNKSMPMLSGGFAFDMQFLKSRLDHMNHVGQDGFSKLLSMQRANPFDTKNGFAFNRQAEQASTSTKPLFSSYNQQQWPSKSTSSGGTNLALQL